MARTKGSKNKTKNTPVSLEPMIPPVKEKVSVAKKDKGAALKEYWANKRAEKLAVLTSKNVKSVIASSETPEIVTDQKDSSVVEKADKQESSTLTMIKKILRANTPQKCYLVIEF